MKLEKQKKLLYLFDTGFITVDATKGFVYRNRHAGGFLSRSKQIVGSLDHQGYPQTRLCIKGATIAVRLHQIVYLAHFRNIPEGLTIDHIDNNKLNNCIQNLQLLTNEDNISKSHRDNPRKVRRGENNNKAKLTKGEVIELRLKREIFGDSIKALMKKYNLSKSAVWSIINRKTWRHI